MGQSLFKKHSKFQNFDEIFSCGMTRLRNSNLDFFIQVWHDQTQEYECGCSYTMSAQKSHFMKRKYWAESVYEIFKIPKI